MITGDPEDNDSLPASPTDCSLIQTRFPRAFGGLFLLIDGPLINPVAVDLAAKHERLTVVSPILRFHIISHVGQVL